MRQPADLLALHLPRHAHWVRVPRFFGDAVMIHAAIAPLRAAREPLILWGPGWVLDLFEGSKDYVATFPEPERKYSPWAAARLLRQFEPQSVINFPKSHRPMLAAWLARVPLRLGCGDHGASFFYTHSVPFYRQDTHFVTRYASVVQRAFPHLSTPPLDPFRPRAEVQQRVASEREKAGIGRYVVFAPGANSHSKRLSLDVFSALGRRLEANGLQVVVLGGGGDDVRLGREICNALGHGVDRTGQGGLASAAAWISQADALVGVDSGLAHVAGVAGIPTVGVFGPTRPHHSAPWGPRVRTVRLETLDCLECMAWECPKPGHPCMREIPEEAIWRALDQLWETSNSDGKP